MGEALPPTPSTHPDLVLMGDEGVIRNLAAQAKGAGGDGVGVPTQPPLTQKGKGKDDSLQTTRI